MHQNLAIILQLFCYGKISFMGLVPDPIRCRSFRSVLRSTRGLWGRFCSSDRVGPHPEVLQILHLNWKVSWTLAANLDRWCRLPLPSLSFFFFYSMVRFLKISSNLENKKIKLIFIRMAEILNLILMASVFRLYIIWFIPPSIIKINDHEWFLWFFHLFQISSL